MSDPGKVKRYELCVSAVETTYSIERETGFTTAENAVLQRLIQHVSKDYNGTVFFATTARLPDGRKIQVKIVIEAG
jgi:hypothetical protein